MLARVKPRLVIVGAGGFGREVLGLAELLSTSSEWQIAGFLDDEVDEARRSLAAKGYREPVLGTICDYQPNDHDRFICAIGLPKPKLQVCHALKSRGAQFVSLIDSGARVYGTATMGSGSILMHSAVLSANASLGDFVTLNFGVCVGHDARIEDGCTLSPHCDIGGYGHLKEGVFVGSHGTVHPGVRVGEWATIGAGSCVFREVQPHTTVLGVPAKAIF